MWKKHIPDIPSIPPSNPPQLTRSFLPKSPSNLAQSPCIYSTHSLTMSESHDSSLLGFSTAKKRKIIHPSAIQMVNSFSKQSSGCKVKELPEFPSHKSTPTVIKHTNIIGTPITLTSDKSSNWTIKTVDKTLKTSFPYPTPPRSESPISSSSSSSTSRQLSPDHPCKVTSYNGKNFGLTATQTIKRGSLIMKERPLLIIPVDDIDEHITFEHVYPAYQRLPKRKRDLFHSLHKREDEEAEKDEMVNIVETNSIPLQGNPHEEPKSLGLFENICRMNHCCSPNAGWTWYEDKQMLHLYAYTDIPSGAEITASYLNDITLPTSERQEQLLNGYGFECICSSCSRPHNQNSQSDYHLNMYVDLRDEWTEAPIEKYGKILNKAIEKLDLSLNILNREGKYEEFGEVYHHLFRVYAVHGYMEESKDNAGKALAHYTTMWGAEKAAKYTDYSDFAEDPTKFDKWGVLVNDKEERKVKRRKVSVKKVETPSYD